MHGLHSQTFLGMVALYHALAFGIQPIFGWAVDIACLARSAAWLGCLISSLALLFPTSPMLAIALAGIGNAMFHVGGGAISLRLTPHRAAAPGLFVAPGSAGLLIGMILAGIGQAVNAWLLAGSLVICVLMASLRVPDSKTVRGAKRHLGGLELVLAFILLSIALRSLLGFIVAFPWETRPIALVLLTIATVAGKALGGILADRWGWLRVAVGAVLAATPFLACVSMYPLAAIPGLLLLNLTMAVTLVAVAEALPSHPAFAFGLTPLALLLGALPSLLGVAIGGSLAVSVVMLILSAMLYQGLRGLTGAPTVPRPVKVRECRDCLQISA